MTREELVERLQAKYLTISNPDRLMDTLQDLGIVSDEAITIDDVADRDLMAAYCRNTK